jgi:hypothetical protein
MGKRDNEYKLEERIEYIEGYLTKANTAIKKKDLNSQRNSSIWWKTDEIMSIFELVNFL